MDLKLGDIILWGVVAVYVFGIYRQWRREREAKKKAKLPLIFKGFEQYCVEKHPTDPSQDIWHFRYW